METLLGDFDDKLQPCFLQLSNLHGGWRGWSWKSPEFWAGNVCLGGDIAKEAVPPQTSSRGKGQKLDKNTASLGGVGLWAQGVLLTPTFSSVPAGLLSLAYDCVPRAEPGPGRELKSNKYVLDSRISPDMVLHCSRNSLPSIISSDPYNNPER